ncbi:hypothetical protein J1N35_025498 [Gossypium stocksii]|uniref:Major facilitator superfamily (MFS) profile domain-containing protein n=1 Tax=Gossypium stocksii TaxID=47602 RepID=A0A9D3ZW94_9ROSI|nr:hypothetical protein J1N35_025498 [Gossypium stocksii]
MPLCYYRQHLQKKRERQVFAAPPEEMGLSSSSITKDPPAPPSWLLILFCVINMINYVDRGVIASNAVNGSIRTCDDKGICTSGSGIQGEFDLTNFQDGLLSSAFMVRLLVASPIFASLTKSRHPFRLIGVGLSVWTLAAAGCGSAFSFWFIAICRMLVGVGKASFISLAAPFIDDSAPVSQKTAWLAMFYMCIPTGIAVGYVYGGFVGSQFNWRYAFWGEALLMLPFAVFGFAFEPLQLKVADSEASKLHDHILVGADSMSLDELKKTSKSVNIHNILNQFSQFAKDMKALLVDKVYAVNIFGIFLGTLNIYFRNALRKQNLIRCYMSFSFLNADMMFGGITIVCGILGTLSGGFILDRLSASIYKAFILLSGATCLGAIFCFLAFCLRSLYGFIVFFALGEFFVFATQAPVNYVSLHCVKPSLRPLSMAISTVSVHIFGDVPSSPLIGVLQQDNINNWRASALVLTSILFLAAEIWFIGDDDASNDRSESQVCTVTVDNGTPLLYGNGDEISAISNGSKMTDFGCIPQCTKAFCIRDDCIVNGIWIGASKFDQPHLLCWLK